MTKRRSKRRVALAALIVVGLLAAYALAGYVLLPAQVERRLADTLEQRTGRTVTVGEARFDPFRLRLEIRDIVVGAGEREPLLAVDELVADLDWSSLLQRTWIVDRMRGSGVSATVERNAQGGFELLRESSPRRGETGGAPPLRVESLLIQDARLSFVDHAGGEPATIRFEPVSLRADGLELTADERRGRYELSAGLPEGGKLTSSGQVDLVAQRGEGQLGLQGLRLATLRPFLQAHTDLPEFGGTTDATAAYRVNFGASGVAVVIADLNATVSDVAVAASGSAGGMRLASLELAGGRIDSAARRLSAASVSARGGQVSVTRNAAGELGLGGLRATFQRPDNDAPDDPWDYAVGTLKVEGLGVAFSDQSLGAPLAYRGTLAAQVEGIDRDAAEPLAFDATLALDPEGRLQVNGTLAQDASRAAARVNLSGFPLPSLQPVLAHYTRLALAAGQLGAALDLAYGGADGQPRVDASGEITAENLRVDEAASGDRFVSGRHLSAQGRLSLEPDRLQIERIFVDQPGAKLVVSADRRFNVMQMLEPPTSEPGAADTVDAEDGGTPSLPLRIDRIEFEGGEVEFADYSLVLPFATRIESLDGTVVGVAPGEVAAVEAAGLIPPFGTARVTGRVRPLAPTELADLRVEFENVQMPPLSPYTATFAGRKVSSGKLWLDLHYKIVDGRLEGGNEVRLDDFTLGERVAEGNPLNLPLDMAIALLKDDRGRIQLAVPVQGNVNRPKFDYGKVIRSAIAQTLRRIVSSPFQALARVLGGKDAERLAQVLFEPGRDTLEPPQQENLLEVAKALGKRPQLGLTVVGPYDPQQDAHALRVQAMRTELARIEGRTVQALGPLDFGGERTQVALETLARRHGVTVPTAVENENADGQRARYRELFDVLVRSQPLEGHALRALAAGRARAISAFLVDRGGIDRGRIDSGQLDTVQATEDRVPARLELSASAQPPV